MVVLRWGWGDCVAERRPGERLFKDAFGTKSDPFRKRGEKRGRRLSQSKKKGSQFLPKSFATKEAAQQAMRKYNKGAKFDTRAVTRFSKAQGRFTLYFIKRKAGKMKKHKTSRAKKPRMPRVGSKKVEDQPKYGSKVTAAMRKFVEGEK